MFTNMERNVVHTNIQQNNITWVKYGNSITGLIKVKNSLIRISIKFIKIKMFSLKTQV